MRSTAGVLGRGTALRVAGDATEPLVDGVDADVRTVATGSTGVPALEPLVLATHDGETAFFPAADADIVADAAETLADGDLPREGAAHVVAHDPDREGLPQPDSGPLSVGDRRVLGPLGWVNPVAPGDLGALVSADTGDLGGHASADAGDLLGRVADDGLLGRGRGDGRTDEPVAEGWRAARDADGDPVVVVNANESDDRVAADSLLLSGAPGHVLDGAAAVAGAIGAETVVVYCNERDETAADRVAAVADALDDLPVTVEVAGGPDRYVAGEETMALESLQGKDRIEARRRPPRVEEYGLYGRPTVVHTPRTLAAVRALLADGDDADGGRDPDREADADPGTRVVTVSGAVAAPTTVELRTGTALSRAVDAVETTAPVAHACVGGRFGGFTRDLDVPASAPALDAADLGTAGAVELFAEGDCVVREVGERVAGAASDNCGRCVPCREGSVQLRDLLRDVYDGAFDAGGVRELARTMRTTSTCAFGRDAGRTVVSALDAFEPRFRAHADGRCPDGACPGLDHTESHR